MLEKTYSKFWNVHMSWLIGIDKNVDRKHLKHHYLKKLERLKTKYNI